MTGELVRRRVVVHGRVQGVFFRDTARREASRHGVSGWVRNTPEGTVEAELEGEREAVETVVGFAEEAPPAAQVNRVEVFEEKVEGLAEFKTR